MRLRAGRRTAEIAWYVASFGYGAVRVWLARRFVQDYGLDVWRFAIVEFCSIVPYSIGTAKLVGAVIDRRRRRAIGWAAIASLGFLAPDLYLLTTTRHAPTWLVGVIAAWLTLAALFGVRQLRQQVVARRSAVP